MKISSVLITAPQPSVSSFDLFRLSKAKEAVDICANTLRSYNQRGLPFYRQGKAVFVSRAELNQFIRAEAVAA